MLRFLSCIPFAQMLINFSSNHPFRQDILLETSIQSKCCTVEQIAHVFDPVSMHTVRSCAFPVRHFSYLLPYFFDFNMYVIFYCLLSQLILRLLQAICLFSVCHSLVPYFTPKASALLCIRCHTFSLFSFQVVNNLI